MKFSIIIPAYNEEKWISKTLTAVLQQSYTDYEVIVVDNNCTDHTAAVVQEYIKKDARITLITCSIPGILYARNCGLKKATGEVIVQLDADNIPERHWLQKAAKHLRNNHIVALGGFYYHYDAVWWFRYGGLLVQFFTLPLFNYYVQKHTHPGFIKGAFIIGGNAFIRKWVLDDMGGYDTTHTFCSEDLVTARSVAHRGWVQCCFDLTVKSSARRHKELGYMKVQAQYNLGTKAVLTGKAIPKQPEETEHPR